MSARRGPFASRLRAHAFVTVLLAAVVPSSAGAERLPIRIYTTEQGLAHARVRRIVRDARGFLWFCTADGLSRFDGLEFVTTAPGTDCLIPR
jgi:ligand-binding sensor domain-containing protein